MKYLAQNKAWDIVGDYNIDKLLYLLIDRFDDTDGYNGTNLIWLNDNKNLLHRNYDLPADMYFTGKQYNWCTQGGFHRDYDKPAIIHFDGTLYYYHYGNRIKNNKQKTNLNNKNLFSILKVTF